MGVEQFASICSHYDLVDTLTIFIDIARIFSGVHFFPPKVDDLFRRQLCLPIFKAIVGVVNSVSG